MFPTLLLTISLILTIAGFFSQYGWWFDLASHFRVQYLALQLICVILCLPKKRWKLLIITTLAVAINLSLIAPFYMPNQNAQTDSHDINSQISILLINLNSYNSEYEKTINYIQQENPDILALEEINNQWISALSDTLSKYPYFKFIPRNDNFGIGLYSKIKPEQMEIKYYGAVEVPSVLSQFTYNNRPFTLLFTHPVPPVSLNYFHWRNEQLETISSKRTEFRDSLILVGDLNTTPWSYWYQSFIKKMNLVDSRKRKGLHITWPTMLPIMGLTIDYVLVSNDIIILEHKVGPNIGSDHYPVFAKLNL